MRDYEFVDSYGTFRLQNPELTSYLYFPIANETGVMGSITPVGGGDLKMGQNTYLLAPVSSEDLHNNKASRNFWCQIEDMGIWSVTGKSALQEAELFTKEKEETELVAGYMWQKVTRTSVKYGLTAETLSFVPFTEDTVEIMQVKLRNTGMDSITLTPIAAIPLYGRSADNIRDHRHVTSLLHRIETVKEGILVNPTLTFDERGHKQNKVWYGIFGAMEDGKLPESYYPCVEDFIGEGGSFENPGALWGEKYKPVNAGYKKNGYEALGGLRFKKVTLKPGEEVTYQIILAFGEGKEQMLSMIRPYLSKEHCGEIFEQTNRYWREKVNIGYGTNDKNFDAWMGWVNFQPILRRIYGCSFLPHHDYGKGGRGWRDLWQDCLALLMMNPTGVKEMLYDNFAGVRIDGSNATIIGSKTGEFIADRNNITRIWMDHGVWPFLTTSLYIGQTGDIMLLLKETTYFRDPQVCRGEEKDPFWKPEDGNHIKTAEGTKYYGTILEHLLVQHLTAFYDVGEHNHIRLRGADWNDALDMAVERGESVAFTAMYGDNLEQLAGFLDRLELEGKKSVSVLSELTLLLTQEEGVYEDINKKRQLLLQYCTACRYSVKGDKTILTCSQLAKNLREKARFIKEHIREKEWLTDSRAYSWYNSYYDNNGNPVEGEFDLGVRMMLTGQVFAIMSGVADKEQIKAITQAADQYLYKEEIGGYRLNTDFKELKTDLGRMFGFAYGSKENGAVFSHMAVMYANALYQKNFIKEGYRVLKSLYNHLSDFEKSRIYPGIPEYIGDNGRGLYHYLTGSASWLLITVLTEIFGIKGKYGELSLEPKLRKEQFNKDKKAWVTCMFAERHLKVTYNNKTEKEAGEYSIAKITIDGELYSFTEYGVIRRRDLQLLSEKGIHEVVVELL
ncbi:hypothetical protein acsn021_34840 [Anaerocolumna cellulosilytica]|uniref:Uncharacterized protein n=1 Tax=Anaerocolumna cellulosilytica TaxID=433286 RepID=A0A6S6R9W9_9FIRM|nr:cellobiose phosphorylase [Anaerocolumna cellulosilytica]MBB5195383.1 cellobiose phosphorylase [Anaerocolumna cellulosilytica]BCJ95915.1 hypothetical protein acsn021_34840 [Anaerocolumna cellulosilytica]